MCKRLLLVVLAPPAILLVKFRRREARSLRGGHHPLAIKPLHVAVGHAARDPVVVGALTARRRRDPRPQPIPRLPAPERPRSRAPEPPGSPMPAPLGWWPLEQALPRARL